MESRGGVPPPVGRPPSPAKGRDRSAAPCSSSAMSFRAGYSSAGCSPAEPASASPTALSMHWGRGAGNCLPANGNLSLVSVSQARGAVQSVTGLCHRFVSRPSPVCGLWFVKRRSPACVERPANPHSRLPGLSREDFGGQIRRRRVGGLLGEDGSAPHWLPGRTASGCGAKWQNGAKWGGKMAAKCGGKMGRGKMGKMGRAKWGKMGHP